MSLFVTKIPVDVEQVTKLLPKRAYVERVEFKDGTVNVVWDDDDLHSGFTFPVEFSRDALQKQKLPKGVRRLDNVPTPSNAAVAPDKGACGK